MRRIILPVLIVAAVLVPTASASAETCSFIGAGPGASWHLAGNWSCTGAPVNKVPTSADTAIIDASDNVAVTQNETIGVFTQTGGTITFSGDPTVTAVAGGTASAGTLTGAGTLSFTTGGSFSKTTAGQWAIQSLADVVVDVDATFNDGNICLNNPGPGPGTLEIKQQFTIPASAPQGAFNCGGGTLSIASTGTLIKNGTADLTDISSPVTNAGTINLQTGNLRLFGNSTQTGSLQISAGATAEFFSTWSVNATGSITGAGAVSNNSTLTIASTATFTPASVSQNGGTLTLNGTSPTFTPSTFTMAGGTFSSTRNLQPTTLNAQAGVFTGDFTTTVTTGGSFAKTTAGQWVIQSLADVIVDVDATFNDGNICLNNPGPGPGTLEIKQQFTIPASAPQGAFNCGGGTLSIASTGTLIKNGTADLTDISSPVTNAGTINLQTGNLRLFGNLGQTAGTTQVASGATLGLFSTQSFSGGSLNVAGTVNGPVTLTGSAVLTGAGTLTGTVTNTSGTVRPGSSPGKLTIDGTYSQGASGTLEVEIAGTAQGTGFDWLDVNGTANLNGTVAVLGTYNPLLSDTFQFLTSDARNGTFASVTQPVPALPGGKNYSLAYPGTPNFGAALVLQAPQAPVNQTPPSVAGSASVGQTLTCDEGTWTNAPSFAFAWLRNGQVIGGQTSATYTLTEADAGQQISCRVTGSNLGGGADATSAGVAIPVPTAAPQAAGAGPSVSGGDQPGATLTCAPGTFTGTPQPTVTIQWLRDGQPIAGATGATYKLSDADAGKAIACRVTATNSAGQAVLTSQARSAARAPEQVLASQTREQVATSLGLPSAKKCVSRRAFTIRVRQPRGVTIRAARIQVNRKTVKSRKVGGRFGTTVDLRGLPKGQFTVTITVTTNTGRKITGQRRYKTCAPKRGTSGGPRL